MARAIPVAVKLWLWPSCGYGPACGFLGISSHLTPHPLAFSSFLASLASKSSRQTDQKLVPCHQTVIFLPGRPSPVISTQQGSKAEIPMIPVFKFTPCTVKKSNVKPFNLTPKSMIKRAITWDGYEISFTFIIPLMQPTAVRGNCWYLNSGRYLSCGHISQKRGKYVIFSKNMNSVEKAHQRMMTPNRCAKHPRKFNTHYWSGIDWYCHHNLFFPPLQSNPEALVSVYFSCWCFQTFFSSSGPFGNLA